MAVATHPHRHLADRSNPQLQAGYTHEEHTDAIGAAHAVKEHLRLLLARQESHRVQRRLYDFSGPAPFGFTGRSDTPSSAMLL